MFCDTSLLLAFPASLWVDPIFEGTKNITELVANAITLKDSLLFRKYFNAVYRGKYEESVTTLPHSKIDCTLPF